MPLAAVIAEPLEEHGAVNILYLIIYANTFMNPIYGYPMSQVHLLIMLCKVTL